MVHKSLILLYTCYGSGTGGSGIRFYCLLAPQQKTLHLHVRTACIAKLTRRVRDSSTPHPCTTAPSTRDSRGYTSIVTYAESSPASSPWPTHPGKEASLDRKKQGTHRFAAAEHHLLQLAAHAAVVAVRQPSGGLPLYARRGVVEPPQRRH